MWGHPQGVQWWCCQAFARVPEMLNNHCLMKGQTAHLLSACARVQGLVHHWNSCSVGAHFATAFTLFSCIHFTRPTISTTRQHRYKYEACGLWSLEDLSFHEEQLSTPWVHDSPDCVESNTKVSWPPSLLPHAASKCVCIPWWTSLLRHMNHFTFICDGMSVTIFPSESSSCISHTILKRLCKCYCCLAAAAVAAAVFL